MSRISSPENDITSDMKLGDDRRDRDPRQQQRRDVDRRADPANR